MTKLRVFVGYCAYVWISIATFGFLWALIGGWTSPDHIWSVALNNYNEMYIEIPLLMFFFITFMIWSIYKIKEYLGK